MTLLIQFHDSYNSFEGHLPAENGHKLEPLINGYLYIPLLDFLQKIEYFFLTRCGEPSEIKDSYLKQRGSAVDA